MLMKCFKSNVLPVLGFSYAVMGVIWFFIEVLEKCGPEWTITKLLSGNIFAILIPGIAGGLLSAVWRIRTVKYPTCKYGEKSVTIRRGDILDKKDGTILIGVNSQLVTSPDKVVQDSIHWKLMQKYGTEEIEKIFKKQRQKGDRDRKFFSGRVGDLEIIFLIMSELKDGNACASENMVGEALEDFFNHQECIAIKKRKVYIPLLGGGKSGVTIASNRTVEFIIRKYVQFLQRLKKSQGEHRTESITNKIKDVEVIVFKDDVKNMRWLALKESLELYFSNCIECGEVTR